MLYNQSWIPSVTPYQAIWPTELINQFIAKSNGVTSVAISNLTNYAKPSKSHSVNFISKGIIGSARPHMFAEGMRLAFLGRSPFSERLSVKTPDGLSLSGILIPGWHSPYKAIIFCNPKDTPMEVMGEFYLRLAYEAGCTGVIFNQRGVDQSQGEMTPEGYILDAFTMFEYLVHVRHMHPNDIIIYGTSMGGGWGAEAAALVQKQYPWAKINFVSERSFSSLASEAKWFIGGIPLVSGMLANLALTLGKAHVFNAKAAVETLKGRVCIVYHKRDGVVPYPASLNRVIQITNCQCEEIIRLELLNNDPSIRDPEPHTRPFTEAEFGAMSLALKRILNIPEYGFPKPDFIKQRLILESRFR